MLIFVASKNYYQHLRHFDKNLSDQKKREKIFYHPIIIDSESLTP